MSLIDWFNSLFTKQKHIDPLPHDNLNVTVVQAINLALSISSGFEGSGYGNVVGNFDDQGLTCGALGFTWGYGVQQELVYQCNSLYPGLIQKMMPNHGTDYLVLARQQIYESMPVIEQWSKGGKVLPEYKNELTKLWASPEMIKIQCTEASKIAHKAYVEASNWSQGYRKLVAPTLHEFIFFFDVCVQNGSMKGLTIQDAINFKTGSATPILTEVLPWYSQLHPSMTAYKDVLANVNLWSQIYENLAVTFEQQLLFIAGYLRAKQAPPRYQSMIMGRKGTIACLKGYVNRQFYDLGQACPQIKEQVVS